MVSGAQPLVPSLKLRLLPTERGILLLARTKFGKNSGKNCHAAVGADSGVKLTIMLI